MYFQEIGKSVFPKSLEEYLDNGLDSKFNLEPVINFLKNRGLIKGKGIIVAIKKTKDFLPTFLMNCKSGDLSPLMTHARVGWCKVPDLSDGIVCFVIGVLCVIINVMGSKQVATEIVRNILIVFFIIGIFAIITGILIIIFNFRGGSFSRGSSRGK